MGGQRFPVVTSSPQEMVPILLLTQQPPNLVLKRVDFCLYILSIILFVELVGHTYKKMVIRTGQENSLSLISVTVETKIRQMPSGGGFAYNDCGFYCLPEVQTCCEP